MNHYILTFDIDTTEDMKTNHNYIYAELCNLTLQGYTVNELPPDTTFLISHTSAQYQSLLKLCVTIFSKNDRWTLAVVASDKNGNLLISHTGIQFNCNSYTGKKLAKTIKT